MKKITKRLREFVDTPIDDNLEYIKQADALLLEAATHIEAMEQARGEPVAYKVHEKTIHGEPHWYFDHGNYAATVEALIHNVKLTPLYV